MLFARDRAGERMRRRRRLRFRPNLTLGDKIVLKRRFVLQTGTPYSQSHSCLYVARPLVPDRVYNCIQLPFSQPEGTFKYDVRIEGDGGGQLTN